MASLKAERPIGSQSLYGQAKKEPVKAGEAPAKAPASKPAAKPAAPKKAEQKPREPKKKARGGKPAAKN